MPDALAWGFWTGSMCGEAPHSADEGNKILQAAERRGERETERGVEYSELKPTDPLTVTSRRQTQHVETNCVARCGR